MRITVTHNKGREEAMKTADKAVDQLIKLEVAGMVKMSDGQKTWNDATMTFSVVASVGPFRSPVHGTMVVTDTEITLDCVLPALLTRLVSEKTLEQNFENRVRGLLGT